MRSLAIIPARGGSKGVKDKNIRLVDGMPLIAYAIQAVRESRLLTHSLVSTDSPGIAAVAKEWGGSVTVRPAELAEDHSQVLHVVQHHLEALRNTSMEFDLVILLQPTSPIRSGSDIDAVIEMFSDPEVDGVISVVPMDDVHPARMYQLDDSGWMNSLIAGGETRQRQDLPVVYYRNGCIYAVRTRALYKEQTLMVKRKKAYVMPRERLVNIDDERDLLIAEVLVKHWKEGKL